MKKMIADGRVMSDPQLNNYRSNGRVCKEFSILSTDEILVQGIPQEQTEFITCRCFAKDESDFEKKFGIISKDEHIQVEGLPSVEAWKDKESGKVQSRLIVSFDRFKPVG